MRIVSKSTHHEVTASAREIVEEKLTPIARLLGKDSETALLEVEVESAPAEGRSSTPIRVSANLTFAGNTYHAEAVKPTPESAADRVRSELESEVRRVRGRGRNLIRRGQAAVKRMLRFGN